MKLDTVINNFPQPPEDGRNTVLCPSGIQARLPCRQRSGATARALGNYPGGESQITNYLVRESRKVGQNAPPHRRTLQMTLGRVQGGVRELSPLPVIASPAIPGPHQDALLSDVLALPTAARCVDVANSPAIIILAFHTVKIMGLLCSIL